MKDKGIDKKSKIQIENKSNCNQIARKGKKVSNSLAAKDIERVLAMLHENI